MSDKNFRRTAVASPSRFVFHLHNAVEHRNINMERDSRAYMFLWATQKNGAFVKNFLSKVLMYFANEYFEQIARAEAGGGCKRDQAHSTEVKRKNPEHCFF